MLPQKFSFKRENHLLASSVGKLCELNLDVQKSGNNFNSVSSSQKRSSGALVLDILPAVTPCEIVSISFKNFYTAFITIKVKILPEEVGEDVKGKEKWSTCLYQYQLMPNPHCETGSQDYFTISSDKMLFSPRGVYLVRLLMQQPSPAWISFKVENISLQSDRLEKDESNSMIMKWLKEQDEDSNTQSEEKTDPAAKEVAEHMQRLWALSETVQLHQQTQSSLGRYDVDGSYEINLLSYT